ncbi:MAG: MazG family protein [Chloroflexi bacterium]|nr:MazG family protein [Chloroflexota bacterium]
MIHIVGLGTSAHLDSGVAALMQQTPLVYLRTVHHPAVAQMPHTYVAFDQVLMQSDGVQHIIDVLTSATEDVVYAVPGHPRWGDMTVHALLRAHPTQCIVHAAPMPLDTWANLVGDTVGAWQVCDALQFMPVVDDRVAWSTRQHHQPYPYQLLPLPVRPHHHAWVCNLHDATLATYVYAQLREAYAVAHRVALITHDQQCTWMRLDELPMWSEWPATLYLPALEALDNHRTPDGIAYIIMRLLGPGGCPWDHEQTPQSLRRTLLEETYEAIDALDRGDDASLVEELGDVLLNILMQAEMARQAGRFCMADVYAQVSAKFIRRHPHVFGDTVAQDTEAVLNNWYNIKQREAAHTTTPRSPLAGVPLALPALTATGALINKSKRHGVHVTGAPATAPTLAELGEQLFALAVTATQHDLDAEAALREINARYRRRVDELFAANGHLNNQTEELWRDASPTAPSTD